MKWTTLIFIVFAMLVSNKSIVYAQTNPDNLGKEIIVFFKKRPTAAALFALSQKNKKIKPKYGITGIKALVYDVTEGSTSDVLAEVAADPNIESVLPNQKLFSMGIPNDPLIAATPVPGQPRVQWNMFNTKFASTGVSAWDVSSGSPSIVIAIVDSGVDSNHPDLAPKISSLINCAGVTCKQVSSLTDTALAAGHGTHIAGLAGAATNNNLGMASAGFNTKLMIIKMMRDDGSMWISDLINSIAWAADHGARVINLSLGTVEENLNPTFKAAISEVITYAWNQGIVLVGAAGNCGNTTNKASECAILDLAGKIVGYAKNSKIYPAAVPAVIAVAALTVDNRLASYSEHNNPSNPAIGNWISVAAPGGECSTAQDKGNCIASTLPANLYGYLSGTSQSTPLVSGLAALAFSINRSFSNTQVRSIIETTANRSIAAGATNNGAVDALSALNLAQSLVATVTIVPIRTPTATASLPPPPTATRTPTPTPTLSVFVSPTISSPVSSVSPTPWSCPAKSQGDANCDGRISLIDFEIWRREFNREVTTTHSDYNLDNRVSLIDFEIWRREFNRGATTTFSDFSMDNKISLVDFEICRRYSIN